MVVKPPGEDSQDTGRDGLHAAKRWLEMSTRVKSSWTHRDKPMAELLGFPWPGSEGSSFTFDMGGVFRGDDLDGQSFMAEVKNYKYESDLPTHYRDFLAKCYVAIQHRPTACGQLIWLSWAPFQAQRWHKHVSVENIENALLHKTNRNRVFGTEDEREARGKLDAQALVDVSTRVWLLTLCHQQEKLVPTREHFAEVIKMITAEAI